LLGGLSLRSGMVVQSEKETFLIPEFRKHYLKISWKSVDNYYLLALRKIKKLAEKLTFYFLTGKLTKIFKHCKGSSSQ